MRGIDGLRPNEGLEALAFLLNRPYLSQVGVMPFDFGQWSRFYPEVASSARFLELAEDRRDGVVRKATIKEDIVASHSLSELREILEAYLREQIAQVIKLDPARIEPGILLTGLGFDSLMALELRNRLEASLEITLPVALIWAYPSLSRLTSHLVKTLAARVDGGKGAVCSFEDSFPDAPIELQSGKLASLDEDEGIIESSGTLPPIVSTGNRDQDFSLSRGQAALWFLHQLAPESAGYNVVGAVRVLGGVDVAALKRAFQRIVDRHSSLRVQFKSAGGAPRQVIRD
ncbi:MAG: phosphopantetheine-binding protein, partial [Blastocatellia bacterium]